MNSNKIIKSLWIGNSLSNMEQLCIASYLQNGHDFHLYTYNDHVSNVPKKTKICDANEIIPKEKIFRDSNNIFASFSDWFRYKLLFEKGGWWVDMDTICLKPFNFRHNYCFATEGTRIENMIIANSYIKAPKKADFLLACLQYIEDFRKENDIVPWGTFGPNLLTTTLLAYDSSRYIKAPLVFCPIHWPEMYKLITKQEIVLPNATFAIHLWNECWRRGNLHKDAIYHPNSIYETFKIKYGLSK